MSSEFKDDSLVSFPRVIKASISDLNSKEIQDFSFSLSLTEFSFLRYEFRSS
jgi:hypothetical protein